MAGVMMCGLERSQMQGSSFISLLWKPSGRAEVKLGKHDTHKGAHQGTKTAQS